MKRYVILTAVLALIMPLAIAGNQSDRETRDLKGFTKINFGISGTLTVNIGPEFKVELDGEKDDLQDIITEVSSGRLVIKKENWRFNLHNKVNVYVTLPELTALSLSGSGRAEIKDPVKTDDLNLSVSGSGKLYTASVDVNNLECSISGSGDIYMGDGNVGKGDLTISGSGNYTGETAKIADAGISISGSGSCICNVTELLKGSISGSGNVSYLGDPKIDVRVSGSGKVKSR